MNIGVLFFTLMTSLVLQGLLPGFAIFAGVKFPLGIGVVVYYALYRSKFLMVFSAFLSGLFLDGLSLAPMGISSFCLILIGLFVFYRREVLFLPKGLAAAFFGAMSCIYYAAGLFLFLTLYSGVTTDFSLGRAVSKILFTGFLGALTCPLICRLIKRLDQLVGNVVVEPENEKS